MVNLIELPDDILIPILFACDIETIFTIRLTCISLSRVIEAYITTIAPKSARVTYPDCDLLLTVPDKGYSLAWLRSRIPAQLASITLDKDKLRRIPCISSGFPYGIPSESDCDEAILWRKRVAKGWSVLRSLYLISKEVHSKSEAELQRPNVLRWASGSVRGTRLWQAMSCAYPGCTQHGIKQIFESKTRTHSESSPYNKTANKVIEDVKRREAIILEKRIAYMENLPQQVLISYTHLWRLLYWTFRPYNRPEETAWDFMQDWDNFDDIPRASWQIMISDIWQGCSWLNWFVLHIGPSPFIKQWSLNPQTRSCHTIRNMVWTAWVARTSHQIEVEREYACDFEFALRKKCLTPERVRRLELEKKLLGRSIRTISLDCIPWSYDLSPSIPRQEEDFPWYKGCQQIWMDGSWYLRTRPGTTWRQPGMYRRALFRYRDEDLESLEVRLGDDTPVERTRIGVTATKGPLAHISYLVYLGIDSGSVWRTTLGTPPQFSF